MGYSGRFAALSCAVALLLPLAACSKDSKKPTAASAQSSFSSTSSSSSSASLSPLPTSASSSADPCNAAPPPASAVNVTHADADYNGDGTTDTLTVYGTGSGDQPSPYHAQLELGGAKGTIDTVIADAATDNNQVVKALGGTDITASAGLPPDGSGAEAFVEVGSGASDALVGVFQLLGCLLTRLTGPQGSALSLFPVGGSVTHLDGLRCDGTAGGQRLVQLSATSTDGVSYETKETRLQVQAGAFGPIGTPITNTIDGGDPRLQAFSAFDCPGVQAP
jgi:hypothetical protein